MPAPYTHDTLLSPFTWRYGSEAMRYLWSEVNKRRLWRRIWVALAEAQHTAGWVSAEQVADLRAHQEDIDMVRALEIEAEIRHDLVAEMRCFAEQCPVGGGIIHLGATSMDIEDNADALRLRSSLDLILTRLRELLLLMADRIEAGADHVCIGFTHLQPAAPTTVGYRLANYGQDLLANWEVLGEVRARIRGKGFKGAVGTSATFHEMFGDAAATRAFETQVMAALELEAYPVSSQTVTRHQDWTVISALAGLALTLYKLAFDLRLLQAPSLGEWAEPFSSAQVGSSAMPFKRNPVNAENINSLARYVAALPQVAWENAANNLLERTLDDSANRRVVLPEAFLATEEILLRAIRIVGSLRLDHAAISRNLNNYGTFAATERLLIEVVRLGGDRQVFHDIIRQHSLTAWESIREGGPNSLVEILSADTRITALIPPERVRLLMRADGFIGDAPERSRALAAAIRERLSRNYDATK